MSAFIWRDALDKNTFSVGVRQANGDYTAWGTIFIDGLLELFGHELYENLLSAKVGEAVPVEFTAKVKS